MQVDDIERPLVSGDPASVESNESTLSQSNEQPGRQTQGSFSSTHSILATPKQRLPSASSTNSN